MTKHASTRFARVLALAALAVAALALAACGSSNNKSSSSTSTGGGSAASSTMSSGAGAYGSGSSKTTPKTTAPAAASGALALTAQESGGLSFSAKTLSAKAGKVTIVMRNPGGNSLPHAIAVEGNGVDKSAAQAQPGGTSKITVTLKPGTYTFYCPVPGHRQAGMEGKLTVR